MLHNHGDCVPGPAVCCDTLFAIGESIRDLALAGVNNPACFLDECHNPGVEGIVTIGQASSYPEPDLLTVSMQRLVPRTTNVPGAQGRTPGAITFISTWQVELIESGWITFEDAGDEQVGLPDPGYVQMLSLHSYAHAEQMFRSLANAVATGGIAHCQAGNCGASMGELFPVEPLGHLVGWRTSVMVPVDFSKVCDGPTPS